MHDLRQQRAVGNTRCQNVKEKRVGALVAQDKGNALFIGRDDALRKTVDAFLAKQMMGDKRGHNDPFDFIRCHPLCPPRAHAKPAMVNDGTQTVYASPQVCFNLGSATAGHGHRRGYAIESELHKTRGTDLDIVHCLPN